MKRRKKVYHFMKKLLTSAAALLIAAVTMLSFAGCSGDEGNIPDETAEDGGTQDIGEINEIAADDDIVILFTNDVHCQATENIGYAGLAAYKKQAMAKSRYVTLVDVGDAVQGGYLGSVSKGEAMIKMMNAAGYDLATFGNHEFDYGIERLDELMDIADFEYLNCTITYIGSGENRLADVKPYKIMEYGGTSVAFIGIPTPNTFGSSTPKHFQEDGKIVYDFLLDGTGEKLWSTVQKNIDECRAAGADYVVLLSHLGEGEDSGVYTSRALIENTAGADVLLDGHSHSYISCSVVKNKKGEEVFCAQTGTGLNSIGQLIITRGGYVMVGCISDYTDKDAEVSAEIEKISAEYEELFGAVIGHTDNKLSITDEAGVRLVRARETGIGDFCADAYRYIGGTDISYINGGGIRASIEAGDITYRDLINVHPFSNMLCTMELTGSEILDMLEYFCSETQSEYVGADGSARGEFGSFPNMSGIRFTVDTSVESSVITDENDMLTGVGDTRRVGNVMILRDGEYTPIDPEGRYTITSIDYMLKNGGSGMEKFLAEHEVILDSIMPDYMALTEYLQSGVDMTQYYSPDGRITIVG